MSIAHHHRSQTPRMVLHDCDALRNQWLAWLGRTKVTRSQALIDLGWKGAKHPRWAGQGNIPEQYRYRMARMIEGGK